MFTEPSYNASYKYLMMWILSVGSLFTYNVQVLRETIFDQPSPDGAAGQLDKGNKLTVSLL